MTLQKIQRRKAKEAMMADSSIVKEAKMTEGDRKKLIYSAILSAAALTSIGAVVKDRNAKKARQKAKDVHSARNAIVVPIKKSKFMEGLPTPEEHAEMFGVKPMQIGYVQPASLPPPSSEDKNEANVSSMSPEEIAAKKKDILKGRKMDFFKRASDEKKDESGEAEKDDKEIPDLKVEEKGERTLFRDQEGKFVSPTDPVAVEHVKKADILPEIHGWSDLVFHPLDTASRALGEAKERPMWIAGGMLGSFFLAGMLADAINEKRRKRSKERLDKEREKYVDLLEGSEKMAESNGMHIGDFTGAVVGGAFAIPAVLTAMITNRIIENRKEEKKKKKDMSNSYPEEPIILYKTSENKEIKIDPSTALMLIMVKKAMIMETEMAEAKLVKRAQVIDPRTTETKVPSIKYSDEDYKNAVDYAVGHMTSDENRGKLLDLIKLKAGGGSEEDQKKLMASMLPGRLGGVFGFRGAPENFLSIAQTPEFKARLAQSGKLQESIANNFIGDENWIKYKNSQIDDSIASGMGVQKGGLLHTIISWIAKNFGIGDWMFKRKMNQYFQNAQNLPSNNQNKVQNGQNGKSEQNVAAAQQQVQQQAQQQVQQQTQSQQIDYSQDTQLDPTRIGGIDPSKYEAPTIPPATPPATTDAQTRSSAPKGAWEQWKQNSGWKNPLKF